MNETFWLEVDKAIEARAKVPSHIRFQEMVDRGAIDEDGNVILRRPAWGGQMTPDEKYPGEHAEKSRKKDEVEAK